MEEKKLREIEAKLSQLIKESRTSEQSEIASTPKTYNGVAVIRRRKGHRDLHIA